MKLRQGDLWRDELGRWLDELFRRWLESGDEWCAKDHSFVADGDGLYYHRKSRDARLYFGRVDRDENDMRPHCLVHLVWDELSGLALCDEHGEVLWWHSLGEPVGRFA